MKKKEEAQAKETELAEKYGCESHAGGDEPDILFNEWYIYGFEYDKKK